MKKIFRYIYYLQETTRLLRVILLLTFSFFLSCTNKGTDLIKIPLADILVDTTSDMGMFLDIIPESTTYDSVKQRVTYIKGHIEIEKINKGKNRFGIEIYIKNGNRFVRIDSDQDGSFIDEFENSMESNAKIIELKDHEINIGTETKKLSLFVTPFENTLFPRKDEFDLKPIGFKLYVIRRNGEFLIQNKYIVSVINFDDSNYSRANSMIHIRPVYKKEQNQVANKIGDKIHLDRTTYTISSIEPDGSLLYLEKNGITEKQIGYLEGDYALEFNGKNLLNGKPVSLIHEKEKLTLLDFWGTWCGPCLEISDELKKLSINYKNKLNVIGIACDNDSLKVKKYLLDKGITYLNLHEPLDGKISTNYAVRDFPTFILLDSDGRIIFRGAGIHNFKEVAAIISDIKQ